MRKDRWEYMKQYIGWGATIVAVGAIVLIVFFCMFKFAALKAGIGKILQILMPVIYGMVIAYLLSPIYEWLMRRLMRLCKSKLKWTGKRMQVTVKVVSMTATFAFMIAIVAGLLALVLPRLVTSIMNIVTTFPTTMNTMSQSMQSLFSSLFGKNPQMEENAMRLYVQAITYVENWVQSSLLPQVESLFSYFTDMVLNTIRFLKNILIGMVVAVYLLANKRKFISQGKKMLYAVFGARIGNFIMDNARFANNAFGGFLGGKIVDSAIIGLISGIILPIMNMPYSLLLAVIIGVTNVIPFFGPFIGAIPCAILVFIVNPIQALYFIIFIVILQQFDGNILGPKILGETTGVSSFWVLFSIIFFGGLFGFVGMVIGVPLFAVLEHLLTELVNFSLDRKKLPRHSTEYAGVRYIDEETGQPVREAPKARPRRKERIAAAKAAKNSSDDTPTPPSGTP